MLKNLVILSRTSLSKRQHSSLKKPFKYLSAPVKVAIDESKLPPATKIDKATIEYLEKVSLVGFDNDRAIKIVEEAIRFADFIFEVNTEGVQPMVSVLEDECLHLREDIAKSDISKSDLLSHASKTIENYYVTPSVTSLMSEEKKESESEEKQIKKALS